MRLPVNVGFIEVDNCTPLFTELANFCYVSEIENQITGCYLLELKPLTKKKENTKKMIFALE